ncbi:hypothetical protein [Methanobrevibacter sp.]|uniref:hypothetical protein n=1 Tax=Methanobrevibacter sp. TaxID=66852 RepID=UPI0025FCF04F|nr:hypothetical protein [Methanobrevibacter sp.]MBQ6512068.1 hypothetical protein [Methanobrevibacter sp.]
MKKMILSLLCLFIISCGISCVCASSDIANATQHQDFLQNDTQNVTVDNTTINVEQNSTASSIENITADDNNTLPGNEANQNNATIDNSSSVSNNTTNGPTLDIKGPKIDNDDPTFEKIRKINYWEAKYDKYCDKYGVGDWALYELIVDYLSDFIHGNAVSPVNKDDVFLIFLVVENPKWSCSYINEQMNVAYNFLKVSKNQDFRIGGNDDHDRNSRRMF